MRIVNVEVIDLSPTLPLPKYETDLAAGMDVMACFDCGIDTTYYGKDNLPEKINLRINEELVLYPGERCLIPTGLKIAIPEGYEVQVRPRSGLALKKGITVLNTPGTIDSDYRGMVCIILINHSQDEFIIKHGDKIAQIVLKEVSMINWIEVTELSNTKRGEGGFGHTSDK